MLIGLRSRKHIPSFDLVRPANVEEASRATAMSGFQDRLIKGGFDPVLGLGSREAVRYIAEDYARWEPIVKKLATQH